LPRVVHDSPPRPWDHFRERSEPVSCRVWNPSVSIPRDALSRSNVLGTRTLEHSRRARRLWSSSNGKTGTSCFRMFASASRVPDRSSESRLTDLGYVHHRRILANLADLERQLVFGRGAGRELLEYQFTVTACARWRVRAPSSARTSTFFGDQRSVRAWAQRLCGKAYLSYFVTSVRAPVQVNDFPRAGRTGCRSATGQLFARKSTAPSVSPSNRVPDA
jgi:hypothetical protein